MLHSSYYLPYLHCALLLSIPLISKLELLSFHCNLLNEFPGANTQSQSCTKQKRKYNENCMNDVKLDDAAAVVVGVGGSGDLTDLMLRSHVTNLNCYKRTDHEQLNMSITNHRQYHCRRSQTYSLLFNKS